MVIGLFNESYPPVMDGVSRIVYDYKHTFSALNPSDECWALVSGPEEGFEYDRKTGEDRILRFVMHPLPVISPYGAGFVSRKTKHQLYSIDFDIIHAHSPFYTGRLAAKIAKKKGIPLVMTFHSQFKKDIKRVVKSTFITNLVLKYIIHSFSLADEVWAVNSNTADVLKSYGFKGEIRVVRNFTEFRRKSDEELESLRKEGRKHFAIKEDEKVLLFVGQQRKEKNPDLVLECVKRLRDENVSVKFISVGDGPDSGKYKEYVKKNGLEDCVIFTGTITDRDLMEKIYASADLFCFPSRYDTAGIVVQEASCLNLPSLLPKGAVCTEGCIDDHNAFLSEDDVISYSESIKRILSDDELRRKVGKTASIEIAREKEEAIKEVRDLYSQIIENYNSK